MRELNNVSNDIVVQFMVEVRKLENLAHNLSEKGFPGFKLELKNCTTMSLKSLCSGQTSPYPPTSPVKFGQDLIQ